jgi:acetyl esterase
MRSPVAGLEPESAALVSRLTARGGSLLEQADLGPMRIRMAELVRTCAPQSLPVSATEHHRLAFGARHVEVIVYRPPEPQTSAPALLYFHGGAYTHLSASTHDAVARYLCNRSGAVVINVDYRLAPEHKFPAPIEDADDVLCWVSENARRLGVDPSRINVAGDSAGGTIAIALCLETAARCGPPIRTQVALCPSLTLHDIGRYPSWRRMGDGRFLLSRGAIEDIRSLYLRNEADRVDPRASPILVPDLRGLPAALIVTGKTLEQAVYLAVLFEQAAQLQLLAQSVGSIRPMAPDRAREAHDFLLKDGIVNATFESWARKVARKYPDTLA